MNSELSVEEIQAQIQAIETEQARLADKVAKYKEDLKAAKKKAELKSLTANATVSKNYEVQFGSLGLWTRELSQGDRVHVKSDWGGITVIRLTDGKEYKLDTEYFRLDGQVDPNPDDVHMVTHLGGKTVCGMQIFKDKVKTTMKWVENTCPRCQDKR